MLPWQRPYTIYCVWAGFNPMSEQRQRCLRQLREVSQCRVVLVTPETLPSLVDPRVPLHPAYPYLSEVHKSDYLRCYLMHVHGGGYADIKLTMGSWISAFRDMDRTPAAYINGYRAGGPDNVSAHELKPQWMYLVGAGQFIVRRDTEFTREWYAEVCRILDERIDQLREHPATDPYDCAPGPSGYPIGYTDLMGIPFNRIQLKYYPRTLYTLPDQYRSHYR